MLKLEDILTQKGLGKTFYHVNCEDLKFFVVFEPETEDYILLVRSEGDFVQAPIMGSLLEGFYTKED